VRFVPSRIDIFIMSKLLNPRHSFFEGIPLLRAYCSLLLLITKSIPVELGPTTTAYTTSGMVWSLLPETVREL
jgi:ABC-type Na+ efflux pump permease subunit